EIHRWLPTEGRDTGDVDGVPIVVTRAVGDVLDEALRLAHDVEHGVCDLLSTCLAASADVVGNPGQRRIMEDQVDGAAMVLDVDVVPHGGTVAIQRQRKVVDGVGDQDGDQLLGVL